MIKCFFLSTFTNKQEVTVLCLTAAALTNERLNRYNVHLNKWINCVKNSVKNLIMC